MNARVDREKLYYLKEVKTVQEKTKVEKFVNEFSWLKSRDINFRECLRKYYYNYYGSWGGWELNSPEIRRKLYILKQLKNRHMWIGAVVHSCIERSIKNIYRGIKPLDTERILQITLKMMKGEFISSQRKRYLAKPKTCALFEHEYDIDVSKEEWERVFNHVEECIRNFYGSEIYQNICVLPKENWLGVEEFSHFWLDYVKVWAVLDFAFKNGNDVIIYDWKTGKSEKEERGNVQLACYALYAMEKWKVPVDNIRTAEYNLARNEIYEFPVDEEIIEGVKEYMRGSVRDMKELLFDENLNSAVESDFAKTTDENTCLKCNFKKVCLENSPEPEKPKKPE